MRPILDDLALLYELSLAIGTSLDLETNCDAFLQTLLARKNLDGAAVWVASEDGGAGRFDLVYAYPAVPEPARRLAADHPIPAAVAERPFAVFGASDADYETMGGPADAGGHVAILRLGDVGLLRLSAHLPPAPFDARALNQLGSVLDKFAVSIDGCLAHARLQRAVNERRQAETALRLRDRAMAATTSGMVIVDMQRPDEPITYVNPAFSALTGYPPEEVVGYNCRFLQGPETDPEAVAAIRRALAERREMRLVLRNYRKDGTPFWNELTISPVFDDDGRLTHYVGVQQDLTARVNAEDALRQAKQAAEASSRAKEQFLANMSHEMRTPLNGVLGTAHLLRETLPTLTDEQAEYFDAIQFSADTLLTLINDLLDLAKIGAGKLTFEAVPFRPRDLLVRLVRALAPKAREKGLALTHAVDDAVPPVLVGDAARLGQSLLNLLSNALKFTDRGRVTLTADADPASAEEADGRFRLRVRVSDTGIGIAPAIQSAIFDTFEQARADATRRFGGTGLGLSIVKELTERQGGHVSVESEEGEGSTFTVVVPLPVGDPAEAPPPDPRADAAEGAGVAGARVLLVEDNELNQLVAARILEGWGAVVDVAGDGRAALDRLAAAPPSTYDAVLMDIQMPVMNGLEATRRIREELGLTLPVIALTASVLVEQRSEMEAAGMDDFVLKPFEPADLRRRLAGHLARTAAPAPVVDFDYLEGNALARPAFIGRMIDLFMDQEPSLREALAEARAASDWVRVRFAAHKLKGSASFLGARRLQSALARVEAAVDRNAVEALPALLDGAEAALDEAMASLREVRPRYDD